MVSGIGESSSDLLKTIQDRYSKNQTDEFFTPIINSKVDGKIYDNETVFCFNFRSDRMREICQAFAISPIPFKPAKVVSNLVF